MVRASPGEVGAAPTVSITGEPGPPLRMGYQERLPCGSVILAELEQVGNEQEESTLSSCRAHGDGIFLRDAVNTGTLQAAIPIRARLQL